MSEPGSPQGQILKLAFELGTKRLDTQAARLEILRTRTVTLTSLILGAAGLLIKESITGGAKGGWAVHELIPALVAGTFTTVGLILGVWLAWPTGDWKLAFSAQTIIEGYVDHEVAATVDETHRNLAMLCDENANFNEKRLSHLYFVTSIQLASFALALGGWTWALIATR